MYCLDIRLYKSLSKLSPCTLLTSLALPVCNMKKLCRKTNTGVSCTNIIDQVLVDVRVMSN